MCAYVCEQCGYTALILCSTSGRVDVLALLLDAGARLDLVGYVSALVLLAALS